MRYVRRDAQHFAGLHYLLPALDHETQAALLHHRNLLVVVAMLGNEAALREIEPRHGHGVAVYDLTSHSRVQLLFLNLIPFVELHGYRLLYRTAALNTPARAALPRWSCLSSGAPGYPLSSESATACDRHRGCHTDDRSRVAGCARASPPPL